MLICYRNSRRTDYCLERGNPEENFRIQVLEKKDTYLFNCIHSQLFRIRYIVSSISLMQIFLFENMRFLINSDFLHFFFIEFEKFRNSLRVFLIRKINRLSGYIAYQLLAIEVESPRLPVRNDWIMKCTKMKLYISTMDALCSYGDCYL